jgi:hypothetical protein
MIVIKPKISTYFSLSLIVVALLTGLIFILRDFAYKGSFGPWFYLIAASLITLVLLILLVKMMAGFRFITAGRDQIIVKLPLRGFQKAYPVSDILVWEEEVVVANKKEFRQMTVASQINNLLVSPIMSMRPTVNWSNTFVKKQLKRD